jgi:esterase/lipase superfamily enzyme
MRLLRCARILLLTGFIAASLIAPALAAGNKTVWKVPVFYVTDREAEGDGFGAKRLPEVGTVSGMQAGIVEVSVPVVGDHQLAQWQQDGCPLSTSQRVELPKLTKFKGETAQDLSGEFDQAFAASLQKCKRKDVFIFIHGFNNSFDVAAQNAAHLSFYTGCPVILYSWPSAARVYRYSLDECNNEWSQEHFNEFIEHMDRLRKENGLTLNLVAHSMGNRLFVRATPVFSGRGMFSDIFMVNPDFDAQTFVHYLSRFIPKTGIVKGVRGQLLISRKDKALSAAEGLFGGYTRLGQGADFTLSALTRPDLFSKVWSQPGAKEPDPQESAERVASIERALRVVDVTACDHGAIGHKVPHEYIAWMHNRDIPPEGYRLEVDKSKGVNRMSKVLARLAGQKIAPPVGQYLIVTKDDEQKKNTAGESGAAEARVGGE